VETFFYLYFRLYLYVVDFLHFYVINLAFFISQDRRESRYKKLGAICGNKFTRDNKLTAGQKLLFVADDLNYAEKNVKFSHCNE